MPSPRLLVGALVGALTLALLPTTAFATDVQFTSDPPGLQLSVDDQVAVTPFTRSFDPREQVTIDAPTPQSLLGYDYEFGVWGGRRIPKRSTITVGDSDTTYTAIFNFTGLRTAVGTSEIGTHVSSANPGKGETYRALATRSATLDRLRLYLDPASTARSLSLGIYADGGATPGVLLAGGVAAATAGAWNDVKLGVQPKLVAGRTYWIGLLNPASGDGVLRWRDRAGGSGGPEETSSSEELGSLPASWLTGRRFSDGPLAAYGLSPAPPPPDLGIDVEPGRLNFAASAGRGSPAPQTIAVQANSGGCGPCHWEVSDDAPWLSVTPGDGDWPTELSVSADTKGLAAGTYRATVQIDRGAGIDATKVPVTLRVNSPSADLVGAWGFDESGGSVVSDSSGNGNDGTITGAVRTSGGMYGGGIAFDGQDDFITVPDSNSLDVGDGVTVEGWVRPNIVTGSWRALALKESPSGEAWGAFAAGGTTGMPAGVVFTTAQGRANGLARLALSPTWTHVAMTYDGTAVRLYVSGRLVASTAATGRLLQTSRPLRIGGDMLGEWFDGVIDEVRVYDRALSPAEIQTDIATPITPAG
jgi:hypothetical protein